MNSTIDSRLLLPYDKPISIWKTLSNGLKKAERDYVKFYLGQALIEQCEEIDGEIDSLLDIWRDYRNETVADCPESSGRSLAEPPVVRQRLTTEIEFFVKHIHEQCANNDQIFRRRLSTGHNWSAINYALATGAGDDKQRVRERPVSARDRQGRETPTLVIPEPLANKDGKGPSPMQLLSPRSVPEIDVATVRAKLKDFTLDDIIQRLRQALVDDIRSLEDHVTYVHQRLEEEADYRAKTRGLIREPTLGELKDERNRLEKEILGNANTRDSGELSNSLKRQTSTHDNSSRRSSASSTSSAVLSPRSSLDGTAVPPTRPSGPLRAFAADTSTTTSTKPRLSIDRNVSTTPPVLVRLGSIKQQDLLKKYPSLNAKPTTISEQSTAAPTARINAADKLRRMVLDCRETSS